MVTEIRLYIEGGGDGKDSKALLRKGFSVFFDTLRETARERRIFWNVVTCGSRNEAFDHFCDALKRHPDAFNILLVDSEGPVLGDSWDHLRQRDHWEPTGIGSDRFHLMVQTMEAWIITDLEALRAFYGEGFNANPIPKNPNVEEIDRNVVTAALLTASRNTQKGAYHKIRHGSKLLECVDPEKVQQAAPHCRDLFRVLTQQMGAPVPPTHRRRFQLCQ